MQYLKMVYPKHFKISSTQKKGFQCEEFACDYLQKKGLMLLEKNFKTKQGEIDLIMKDIQQNSLVFIEVRYRKSNLFGGALESIHFYKQQRIIRTAEIYLLKHFKHHPPACRFDVFLITGNLNNPEINWILNAFEIS